VVGAVDTVDTVLHWSDEDHDSLLWILEDTDLTLPVRRRI